MSANGAAAPGTTCTGASTRDNSHRCEFANLFMNQSEIGRSRLALGLALGVIALQVAGIFVSGPATWGFDHLAFLPTSLAWGIVAAAIGLVLLPAPVLDGWASRLGQPGRARIAAATVIVLSVVLFWFGRVREFFLSDSRLLMDGIADASRHFAADTFAVRLQAFVHQLMSGVPSQSASFRLVSIGSGVVWLGALLYAIGTMTKDGRQRFLLAALVVTLGMTKLFYGYPETSPLLAAAVALFVAAGVRASVSGAGEVLVGAAAIAAGATHLTGLLCMPAMAVVLFPRWKARPISRVALLGAPLVLATLYAILLLGRETGTDAYGDYWSEFIPLAGPLHAKQAYTMFSVPHLIDMTNDLFLLGPFVIVGVVLAVIGASRLFDEGTRGNSIDALLAALLIPFLALSWTFNRKLGAARDWDLVASVAVPGTLLFGRWLAQETRSAAWLTRAGVALGAAGALHLGGWILVDTQAQRSLARFERLFGAGAAVSPFARSYAHEEVGATHLAVKRLPEATHAYEEAVKADPGNAKAAGSLGAIYGSQGKTEEAMVLFRETVRLRPDIAIGHFNLANALARRNEWSDAEREYREALRLDPENGLAWLYLGSVIKRQGRAEEARSVWRDGLQHASPDVVRRIEEAIRAE
ncbi:MAG TPA: tetratricopeptide repeat protein [Candidatus Eisenbacteria bacterium]